jgi:hypothetical protein
MPDIFQDRYRELLRVGRQWRNLKYLKWHGFGYAPGTEPAAGQLAIFCPACPQPGINLPEGWENAPNQCGVSVHLLMTLTLNIRWMFMRTIVLDGNFKAEHLKMRRPDEDVPLSEGLGFLTSDAKYKAHLMVAMDSKEVCPLALLWGFIVLISAAIYVQ